MKRIKISNKQYKRISLIYRIGGFFFILSLLILYSLLIRKFIEFVFVFTLYFVTKGLYQNQFHSNSLKQCFMLSIIVFVVLTTIAIDKNISILFSCLLGLITSLASCNIGKIQLKLKDYNYIEPRYNELLEFYNKSTKFNVKTCTKEQMIEKCNSLGFNKDQTEFCIKAFVEKLSEIELSDYCCIELQSAKNKKMYYKKKLMK